MKLNLFKSFLLAVIVILASSCNSTTEPVALSTNPNFKSLALAQNDTFPGLESIIFSIDSTDPNSHIITNLDSLPYQTNPAYLIGTFSFKSTQRVTLFKSANYPLDSMVVVGKDTFNFAQYDILRNYSADSKNKKDYRIKVNVHKVDAEKYVWGKASENINGNSPTSQKAILFGDSIFYFLNNGSTAYLHKSIDGAAWNPLIISGLPANTPLSDMIAFNGKLFLTQDGDKIYSASNPRNWTVQVNPDYNFKSLLFALNNKLWAVLEKKTDQTCRFASSSDGAVWEVFAEIPSNFPVKDFTALSFTSRTNKAKAIVIGGYSEAGELLTTNWNTEDGLSWFDFSTNNTSLDTLRVGASLISYDNKLLILGMGTDTKRYFKESKDEGFTWQVPDTKYNILPANFIARENASFLVLKLGGAYTDVNANRIFIIGGDSATTRFTDSWTGKLNRKSFIRQ